MGPPRAVLITHPGRQHSHQAALALQGASLLAGYWAGVPSRPEHLARMPWRLLRRYVRYPAVPLDPERARWVPFPPIARHASAALLPRAGARRVDLFACRAFDRWVARHLGRVAAVAVVACEISALETFRAARRMGWITLLDAPSLHHASQDRFDRPREGAALHRRITRIKDQEIALADHVLTVSDLARASYLEAGVPAERVHAVSLGVDRSLFRPGEAPDPAPEACRFLFAGAATRTKGFDLLLEAFARVRREEPSAALRVVGAGGELSAHLSRADLDGVSTTGPIAPEEVAAEMRRADCLVLPSRLDSFGLVVAEALASGTPVIVSRRVGAQDLVTEGVSGWTVRAGDAGALAERMLHCARDLPALRAMRPAARAAAEAATWEAYHRRFAHLVASILGATER